VSLLSLAQLADKERGGAWTRLLLQAGGYRHVRVCGPLEARPLLLQIFPAADCVLTKRRSVLHFKGRWDRPLAEIGRAANAGRVAAVVAFSRAAVLGIAWLLKRAGLRVACLYGSLPPETRLQEMQRCRDGQVDCVVCTDVIGHGVSKLPPPALAPPPPPALALLRLA
jgi:ATP-dependent RNA helicase SUPV3L1/SUV3